MRKENKKYLGVSLSALAFSLSYGLTANAQTCVTPPSCETLGYKDTADKCDDSSMVKCPFDTSKVFCRSISTKTKTCDTIGDILLDDKTCAVDANAILNDRTPIGVVFDVSKKLAIALQGSPNRIFWGVMSNQGIDGLGNVNGTNTRKAYGGKNNTSIIKKYASSNNYSSDAVDYCLHYTTKGTKTNDWYLPATGELYLIYNSKNKLNNSLEKVNGMKITDADHWSSSQYFYRPSLTYTIWTFSFDSGKFNNEDKLTSYIRPVLAY